MRTLFIRVLLYLGVVVRQLPAMWRFISRLSANTSYVLAAISQIRGLWRTIRRKMSWDIEEYEMVKKINPSVIDPIVFSLKELNEQLKGKEHLPMPVNKYGTAAIEVVLDDAFEILEGSYDTFKDGFQITDLAFGATLVTSLYGIVSNVGEAVKEKNDLTEEELEYLVEKYVGRGLAYFMTAGGNQYGINKTLVFVTELSGLIAIARKALADGAQIEDLQYLPQVSAKIVKIVAALPSVAIELKDLAAIEVAKIISLLIIEVFKQLGVELGDGQA